MKKPLGVALLIATLSFSPAHALVIGFDDIPTPLGYLTHSGELPGLHLARHLVAYPGPPPISSAAPNGFLQPNFAWTRFLWPRTTFRSHSSSAFDFDSF